MKKSSLLLLLLVVSSALMAQRSPVGIVSVQDSVKSVQFGVISSVAAEACSCLVSPTRRHRNLLDGS